MSLVRAVPVRHKRLPYFHLLWDEDLEANRHVFESVRDNVEGAIEHWYRLYTLHFGDERTLSELEFSKMWRDSTRAMMDALSEGNRNRYATHCLKLGEALAQRGIGLREVIANIALFEDAALEVFPARAELSTDAYRIFDRVCHIGIILLIEAYGRSRWAQAGARISELEREAAQLPASQRTLFRGLVGRSASMRRMYQRIEAAARTRGTILIVGESGSGKELVARAIHECGEQPDAPFVALNCAALPKDLIESELFGYKRGAFSGASGDYLGLFRAADGGTLFLDEITEMSAETQSKLLRAIQERAVRPIGSTGEIPVDVRLVASTNRDPEQAAEAGQLRRDLYYRLQAGVISVPPLRERIEDIPLLAEHFIAIFNKKLRRPTPVAGLDPEALNAMMHYSWPGNVRELSNAIESAFTFGHSPSIGLADLPRPVAGRFMPEPEDDRTRPDINTFEQVECDLIRRALDATEGNKVKAAKLLKISRKKLYAKISKYRLE